MTQGWGIEAGPSIYDADQAFDSTFGVAGIQHKQTYYDPWRSIDKRAQINSKMYDAMSKAPSLASTTYGTGTAGQALTPVFVDPQFVDQTRKLTPLVELIPRKATRGLTYDYNRITAKAGGKWKVEDAAQSEDVDTGSRGTVTIKYGYAVGRVTYPAIAGAQGYADLLQADILLKAQSIKELEEDTIINGDVDTYSTEYDGLIQSITTNSTALGSRDVTLADIRSELATTFNARGYVTLAVTDAATHNNIKAMLQQFQRVVGAAEGLPFGIPGAFDFDGVTFIKSQFMPTSSNSRRILFLDMRYIFLAVLQDVTYMELAQINDSRKYMIKVYEALVITYEGACSQITGIA